MNKKVILFAAFFFVFVLLFRIVNSENAGSISLTVLSGGFAINIAHPMNASYDLPRAASFPLGLNVSSTQQVSSWQYTLEELNRTRAGGVVLGGNVLVFNQLFAPNTTINAVRFANKISVRAFNPANQEANDSKVFFVHVNNSAPRIIANNTLYTCEGTSDDPQFLSYAFAANDSDENDLDLGNYPAGRVLEGSNLFFQRRTSQEIKPYFTNSTGEIYSQNLYQRSGVYTVNISVAENDGDLVNLSDKKTTNISVIEINSPPKIINPIGVQTKVWSRGENNSLVYDFDARDDESGNDETGNLFFNVSFSSPIRLFEISANGKVNFTANQSQTGVFNVSVCVIDESLPSGHIAPEIAQVCGQDGLNQSDCNSFQLTVTNEDRAPKITSFYPNSSNFSTLGSVNNYFNVSVKDPDGNFVDLYWYVDGSFMKYTNASLFSEFNYVFPCGVSGAHYVKVEATDGLLNDSVNWTIFVTSSACPAPPASSGGGGGGGGGGAPPCTPKLGCFDWGTCKSAENGLNAGEISGEDYRNLLKECQTAGSVGDFCGYQTRECSDTKGCNSKLGKPQLLQSCYYTENPSCSDGIKNCHDGSCEFLIDCGGSCGACPTCSDGIQNQGEFGVDCGGPCPLACPVEQPLIKAPQFSVYTWLILVIAVLIIIAVGIKVYVVWKRTKSY